MNRRAFLLGSAAAIVTRPSFATDIEIVQVAPSIKVELMIEDLMTEKLIAAQREIEQTITRMFLYGEGAGEPLGILKSAHRTRSRSKSAVPAYWLTQNPVN